MINRQKIIDDLIELAVKQLKIKYENMTDKELLDLIEKISDL